MCGLAGSNRSIADETWSSPSVPFIRFNISSRLSPTGNKAPFRKSDGRARTGDVTAVSWKADGEAEKLMRDKGDGNVCRKAWNHSRLEIQSRIWMPDNKNPTSPQYGQVSLSTEAKLFAFQSWGFDLTLTRTNCDWKQITSPPHVSFCYLSSFSCQLSHVFAAYNSKICASRSLQPPGYWLSVPRLPSSSAPAANRQPWAVHCRRNVYEYNPQDSPFCPSLSPSPLPILWPMLIQSIFAPSSFFLSFTPGGFAW